MYDVIVIEGSPAGCRAAAEAAASGADVLLIDPRLYLGGEITSCLRPWMACAEAASDNPLLRLFLRAVPGDDAGGDAGHAIQSRGDGTGSRFTATVPLALGRLKKLLLDYLLEAGVTVLFSALPVGLLWEDGVTPAVAGVVAATKAGLIGIRGRSLIDCRTPVPDSGDRSNNAGTDIGTDIDAGTLEIRKSYEFNRVPAAVASGMEEFIRKVPRVPGVDSVEWREGSLGEGHLYADLRFSSDRILDSFGGSAADSVAEAVNRTSEADRIPPYTEFNELDRRTREIGLEFCKALRGAIPEFLDAELGYASEELWIGGEAEDSGRSDVVADEELGGLYRLKARLPAVPDPVSFTRLERAARKAGRMAADAAGAAARSDIPDTNSKRPDSLKVRFHLCAAGGVDGSVPARSETSGTGSTRRYVEFPFSEIVQGEVPPENFLRLSYYAIGTPPAERLPVLGECDVLVVGGGTSGGPAAVGAAEAGAVTILAEGAGRLGGTGTIGGVNAYYEGYREGFTSIMDDRVAAMTEEYSAVPMLEDGARNPRRHGPWNMEVKSETIRIMVEENGGQVFYGCRYLDSITVDACVSGIVAATAFGLGRIESRVTIDATGSGEVAAKAGAEYVMGDVRGGNLQTYNQCHWRWPEHRVLSGRNVDLEVVDDRDPVDITRGSLVAHQNGSDYDFSGYQAIRESRHVKGEYFFTLRDVFLKTRHPDTIVFSRTDFDQHGLQGTLLSIFGFLPYHYEHFDSRFPYRACIPKGFEGLLLAAKGISASKDAFSFMRMQPELQNLGYALGHAAGMAAAASCGVREIEIRRLQELLLRIGVIRPEDIARGDAEEYEHTPEELLDRLASGDDEALLPVMVSPEEQVVDGLRMRMSDAGRAGRVLLSMAAAWFGSAEGASVLAAELDTLRSRPQDPHQDGVGRPWGGFHDAPDTYWRVNGLIAALALSGSAEADDLVTSMTVETDAGGETASHERIHWRRIPFYDRIRTLAFYHEYRPDTKAVPVLERLLSRPLIGGYVETERADGGANHPSALLEVIVARALARCGGKRGAEILAEYTEDVRKTLSDHALAELRELSGEGYGKDATAWKRWIRDNRWDPLPCRRFERY